ncbi:hypothetical protein SAMN05216439_1112 [Methanobrevibacter gottschalkii]|uniref:Uncharacterized protein n=1 Tax=Methanobrevibacter gottschalkii TaxID=190974 RepID=A0A1H7I207_9EURY|nr:hypothetical protein [Methanobrevibacter gottschalkii]SEK55872.1 hypothetical protein SAMN05216439_1112 [Methanobrevibacter gottschalkii]
MKKIFQNLILQSRYETKTTNTINIANIGLAASFKLFTVTSFPLNLNPIDHKAKQAKINNYQVADNNMFV